MGSATNSKTCPSGVTIKRLFTKDGVDVLNSVKYARRSCKIGNPDGSTVFSMDGAEIPADWSQLATDIMVSKYFRKAQVPQFAEGVDPIKGEPLKDEDGKPVLGPERSVKQVVHRLVGCWRHWGERYGYFRTQQDAQVFYDELAHMMLHQMCAPNSPQWFNTGLNWAYGLTGPSQGHYYVEPDAGVMVKSTDSYTRPQPHACFIQSVKDDLVGPGGIMDLWTREARLFKYGSGTGTNFSNLRGEGEALSGGGASSGLMSFLRVGDRAAGAIKSGGTTRRAAKMVCLDLDHPDIEKFVNWKVQEEKKVAALIKAGYESDFNGEAYATVSGQNSNNSVRVPAEFIDAVKKDGDWHLRWRTDKNHISKTLKARKLWDEIAFAAWACADPGVQYDTIINDWNTSAESGRINASNPCSEYMFLDDTACNLASLNLTTFYDAEKSTYNVGAIKHATRLWTIVLEISVLMAQYPSAEIAQGSYDFRTLGLGYANMGTCLMLGGIPYDSREATAVCGALTAIMTGESYAASAELAAGHGPFPKYKENAKHMLRVIRNHRRAAYNAKPEEYEGLSVTPVGIDPEYCPQDLLEAARETWDRALEGGKKYGYRNAQTTVIAPTGTIGLLMDCDTTGIEPDFALVKFKKLAGGGYFKIVNQSVEPALRHLGYDAKQRKAIIEHIVGTLTLKGAPHVNDTALKHKGLTDADLSRIEHSLQSALELKYAFNNYVLGEETLKRLGIKPEQYNAPDFNLLKALGFTSQQIEQANDVICGGQTIEGAPGLKPEHLPVFDCANRCGKHGKRFIHHMGHIKMMAAAQPFISGAISKTINMPNEVNIEDVKEAYIKAYDLGLKAVALYRDGCKLSQPLNSKAKDEKKEEKEEKAEAPVEVKAEVVHPTLGKIEAGLHRKPLPKRRHGLTFELKIGGQKLYVRTGEYEDGSLGEIFLDMSKEGATLRSILNCFAIAVSKGLQYGVPLEEFVNTFTFTRFEPQGIVQGHDNIKTATSVIDLVFRSLGFEYLQRTDFLHVQPTTPLEPRGPELLAAKSDSGDLGYAGEAPVADTARPTAAAAQTDSAPAAAVPRHDRTVTTRIDLEALKRGEGPVKDEPATGKFKTAEVRAEVIKPAANCEPAPKRAQDKFKAAARTQKPVVKSALDEHLESLMGDAPICDGCGHITVRNGACYKCLNCGNSMGCS
ncbi:MAG: adenosylcobalamin-dependent ribonucleoside-diphosphate reductase [Planctomycetes bacterium]|nr:adenosylcobalamin-dependent ribonucleoside-diphosphate reductase [Planctomycetota bacterium]